MLWNDCHSIYFLGIGGIGMSALARYFKHLGCKVSGYDRTETPLTQALVSEGIAVHYDDNPQNFPSQIDLCIYTPAVPSDLKELLELKKLGVVLKKRAEILGEIAENYYTIAVAGTHGKTTTTALIAHLMKQCGFNPIAFIGGIANNFESNLLLGDGNEKYLVVEADEFDHSFLQLHPNISVITSIDADHLDIYGTKEALIESFNRFAAQCSDGVVVRENLPVQAKSVCTFGMHADVSISNVFTQDSLTHFTLTGADNQETFLSPLAGMHNVFNATAALMVLQKLHADSLKVKQALLSFRGVHRRFDVRVKSANYCYVDDYAHHPEEIKACLSAARLSFPDKKLTVVFQPHLFSRTRDFMNEFAQALSLADEVILLDIYPAREKPIEGITSSALLQRIIAPKKVLVSKTELLDLIEKQRPELLITMGAGDIDRFVQPLELMIKKW